MHEGLAQFSGAELVVHNLLNWFKRPCLQRLSYGEIGWNNCLEQLYLSVVS
jgi:hypothetical protein